MPKIENGRTEFHQQNAEFIENARSVRKKSSSPFDVVVTQELYTGTPHARGLIMGVNTGVGEPRFFGQERIHPQVLVLDKYLLRNALDMDREKALEMILDIRADARPDEPLFPDKEGYVKRTLEKIDAGHIVISFDDEDQTKPIGCVGWSSAGDRWLYRERFREDYAIYASHWMVRKDYQQRGIGTALTEYVDEVGRQVGAIYKRGDFIEDNIHLAKIYKQEGRTFLDADLTSTLKLITPSAALTQKDIQREKPIIPEADTCMPLSILLQADDPFTFAPQLTPSVHSMWRADNYPKYLYAGEDWWTKPSWIERDHPDTDVVPSVYYTTFENQLLLMKKLGMARFMFDYKMEKELRLFVRLFVTAIEKPIDTREEFESAWFGFKTWDRYKGLGPLLRGTVIGEKGMENLLLADGSCFYLSDCVVTSKAISKYEEIEDKMNTLWHNCDLKKGDQVQVRLTQPTPDRGKVAQTHAMVLKMDND